MVVQILPRCFVLRHGCIRVELFATSFFLTTDRVRKLLVPVNYVEALAKRVF